MAYFDEYKKNQNDSSAQERWTNLFTWEVARHSVGEEIVVYPLMEKHLGAQGHDLAEGDRRDHQVSYICVPRYPFIQLTSVS